MYSIVGYEKGKCESELHSFDITYAFTLPIFCLLLFTLYFSALTRPGRLDKHVDVPMPDIGGRKAILELYAKKVRVGCQ